MNEREQALRDRLWRVFRVEAQEHIEVLSRQLLDLEAASAGTDTAALVETAFREAHSLKGAARAVNIASIEAVCQAIETVLARIKQREIPPSSALVDALLAATRLAGELLAAEENKTPPPAITATVEALKNAAWADAIATPTPPAGPPPLSPAAEPPPPSAPPPPVASRTPPAATSPGESTPPKPQVPAAPAPPPAAHAAPSSPAPQPQPPAAAATLPETVRVSTAVLDAVRVQAEELLADKLAASRRADEIRALVSAFAEHARRWAPIAAELQSVVAPGAASAAPDVAGPAPRPLVASAAERVRAFLDWHKKSAADLETRLSRLERRAAQDRQTLGAHVDQLLASTRELLMLPFSWLLDGIRQPVRDLAREQGKELHLVVEGDAVELDRRVLAELKAPFLHILRNSIDHGVEPPAERERAGKPRVATLSIRVSPARNGRVEIVVRDDGRGVDLVPLREAIVRAGLLDATQVAALDDDEVLQGAFGSGVSTRPVVTDLSGRGLGLAIVREKIEKLGGSVRLESSPGRGAALRLTLPLSLATFRGVVARVDEHAFVFPVECVRRVLRVAPEQIVTVENRETIRADGEHLSFVRLAAVLGLPESPRNPGDAAPAPVVLVAAAGLRLAFAVDEIRGEQEIVAKKLGPQGAHLPHLAGAALLGDGHAALILDAQELIRLAGRRPEDGPASEPDATPAADRRKKLLVVDDSITSRTLLRGILEGAGYHVETAVDGIDAFAKLRSAPFDLVVTDIDMPRLHGVGLTEKIRADAALASLPVILVTSLDSREDRERGLEAGANAYIVKRSFEESNLLEAVHRFL
jgi:Chemotaxis protein histidine kinase and related kinases